MSASVTPTFSGTLMVNASVSLLGANVSSTYVTCVLEVNGVPNTVSYLVSVPVDGYAGMPITESVPVSAGTTSVGLVCMATPGSPQPSDTVLAYVYTAGINLIAVP